MLNTIDHTYLKPDANSKVISQLCLEAVANGFRGICVPPNYVKLSQEFLSLSHRISTVIGFPFGYNRCPTKLYEMDIAAVDGADELDVVWNLGAFLNGEYLKVVEELSWLVEHHRQIKIKVIVEECYLDSGQKLNALQVVYDSGAWCIKTSTGYGPSGATLDTVKLWKNAGKDIKIKAAGGIKTLTDAKKFIQAGADIIGTGSGVSIAKELNNGTIR